MSTSPQIAVAEDGKLTLDDELICFLGESNIRAIRSYIKEYARDKDIKIRLWTAVGQWYVSTGNNMIAKGGPAIQ